MSRKSNAAVASPILAVCCVCGQVPDEDAASPDVWAPLEVYLERHHVSEDEFRLSHTYCPACYSAQVTAWQMPEAVPPPRPQLRRVRPHR